MLKECTILNKYYNYKRKPVKADITLLWKLGGEQPSVGLFDKITWVNKNYAPLLHTVHTMTNIHQTQTQHVKNHVQLAALVCKTNIGQVRATYCVVIHSCFVHRYKDNVD